MPSTATDFTTALQVPKFNQPGDVLTAIDFDISGRGDGQIRVENQANSAVSLTTTSRCDLVLRRPDNSGIVVGLLDARLHRQPVGTTCRRSTAI